MRARSLGAPTFYKAFARVQPPPLFVVYGYRLLIGLESRRLRQTVLFHFIKLTNDAPVDPWLLCIDTWSRDAISFGANRTAALVDIREA